MTMIQVNKLGEVQLPTKFLKAIESPLPERARQALMREASRPTGRADKELVDLVPKPSPSSFCACAIENAAAFMAETYGIPMSSADATQAAALCAADEAAFIDTMEQIGVDVRSCMPWWKKPIVWIGGAALLGVGAFLLLERK